MKIQNQTPSESEIYFSAKNRRRKLWNSFWKQVGRVAMFFTIYLAVGAAMFGIISMIGGMIDDHKAVAALKNDPQIGWVRDTIGHMQYWDTKPLLDFEHESMQEMVELQASNSLLSARLDKLENPPPPMIFLTNCCFYTSNSLVIAGAQTNCGIILCDSFCITNPAVYYNKKHWWHQ